MSRPPQEHFSLAPDDAVALITERAWAIAAARPGRVMIGVAGGPGVGKSTLAPQVVLALNAGAPGSAADAPMDGFHMKHGKLEAQGLVADKGMPHTFEGALYAEFLADLKGATAPVKGPLYSRRIEDTIEDAYMIDPEVRVVVTEGNYLLLADSPWYAVEALLDLSVFCMSTGTR